MECRDVRPLIGNLEAIAGVNRQAVERHLAACSACRDEAADPAGRFLVSVALPLAIPSPGFTRNVLLRLPSASPLEIAHQQARVHRFRVSLARSAGALLTLVALAGLAAIQLSGARAANVAPALAPLTLAAKAVLNALGQPLVVVAAALAVLLVLAARQRQGVHGTARALTGNSALAAGIFVALLAVNAFTVRHDRVGLRGPIPVQGPVSGDVTSLGGDIVVRGNVAGDVVTLGGKVTLEPGARVQGSVLSGGGPVTGNATQIGQAKIDQIDGWLASANAIGVLQTQAGPAIPARMLGFMAMLLIALLSAILVITWRQGAIEASSYLARFPRRAIVLGILATLGLGVIGVGGTILLAATVVGVVLVPILLLVLQLPFVAGVAAVGALLGTRLAGRPTLAGAVWGIAAQLIVVMALGLIIPVAGLMLFYALGAVGLGAALLVPRRGMLTIA